VSLKNLKFNFLFKQRNVYATTKLQGKQEIQKDHLNPFLEKSYSRDESTANFQKKSLKAFCISERTQLDSVLFVQFLKNRNYEKYSSYVI
jgi:hypothetical protein